MKQEEGQNQSRENFEQILSDKASIIKWEKFAMKELKRHKNSDNAVYMGAEDYVGEVILKILSGEILVEDKEGNFDTFICGCIKKKISNTLRKSPMMVPISNWEDRVDESEDAEGRDKEGLPESLVSIFEDPFEEKPEQIDVKDLMRVCYELLEKKEPELLIVFDERAKGHPNRDIARYLDVDVKDIEKAMKRIVRLLRKKLFFKSTFLSVRKVDKRNMAANNFAENLLCSTAKN